MARIETVIALKRTVSIQVGGHKNVCITRIFPHHSGCSRHDRLPLAPQLHTVVLSDDTTATTEKQLIWECFY